MLVIRGNFFAMVPLQTLMHEPGLSLDLLQHLKIGDPPDDAQSSLRARIEAYQSQFPQSWPHLHEVSPPSGTEHP